MTEDQSSGGPTLKVLVYSDDRQVREQVRLALGRRISPDLPEIEVVDVATQPAAIHAVDSGNYDVVIADGEAVPSGGMGLCHQLKDEVSDCPPVVLLVARVADAWLASWSRADAISTHPVDPVELPRVVAGVVRAASVDFQMGTGRMPMARPEAQAPAKRTNFTDEEIAQVAAYVASLAPGPSVPDAEQYTGKGLSAEEIARGGELFRTNCSACHAIDGRGGALPNGSYAPSLVKTSDKHIYEALRTGPQQMPVFSKSALTDDDVKEIIAYLSSVHSQPNDGGFSLGGLGPISEGLWAWIIGIGTCVLVAFWLAKKGARAR